MFRFEEQSFQLNSEWLNLLVGKFPDDISKKWKGAKKLHPCMTQIGQCFHAPIFDWHWRASLMGKGCMASEPLWMKQNICVAVLWQAKHLSLVCCNCVCIQYHIRVTIHWYYARSCNSPCQMVRMIVPNFKEKGVFFQAWARTLKFKEKGCFGGKNPRFS